MNLKLSPGLLDKIRDHGRSAYPHECCGLLLGRYGPSTKSVAQLKPAVNRRDDSPRNRYLISAPDMLLAERESGAAGLDIVGIYHSHPDRPAHPSEYDREHAMPGYSYIIVSIARGHATDLRSWRLKDDRSEFEAEQLVVACEGRN